MERAVEHRRNQALEALLGEVNELLAPLNEPIIAGFRMPENPVVLVMGLPRSGTTVFMQWLAASGQFSYPTNLLSRFFAAPAIGAKLQLLLTDPLYDFRGELWDLAAATGFESSLGKTRGALAPNEFWYFWRRFFPLEVAAPLPARGVTTADTSRFVAEVAALESILDKPFAMKGGLLSFDVPLLDRLFERLVLVHIRREPFFNMQSLLESRRTYYGSLDGWYSIRPPEYEWLRQEDPYTQVAGQVYFSDRALTAGMQGVAGDRKLELDYEAFCADPAAAFRAIAARFSAQGRPLDATYRGPEMFEATNRVRLDQTAASALRSAFEEISGSGSR